MNGEKTAYPGVRIFHNSDGTDSYYIQYRRGGRGSKLINELAGKSGANGRGGMTAKAASIIRIDRMRGKEDSNEERRAKDRAEGTQGITVSGVWELYKIKNADKPSLKRNDRFSFKHLYTHHDREIRSLTTQDIDRIIVRLKKTPAKRSGKNDIKKLLAPQTIKHAVGLLKRLCNYAESRELCVVPKLHYEMEKFDNRKTEYMTPDEYCKYIEALDAEVDQHAATVIRFAIYTGMRKTAILKLQWRDINFAAETIFLQAENAKKREGAYIPLPAGLAEHIKALPKTEGSEYLFPGKDPGTHRTTIARIARRLKRVAGLPDDFRPMHGLRHNYATQLASSGLVNAPTLQALLTHESPDMTARYTVILDDAMQKAGNLADKIFTVPVQEVNHGN